MNAQYEAEQLKASLERIRDEWPHDCNVTLDVAVDMAMVAGNKGMMMSRCLVIALRSIKELGELTVRTRYHGDAEWRCTKLSIHHLLVPMRQHANEAQRNTRYSAEQLGIVFVPEVDRRISFELFVAATIETYRRLTGESLVEYALARLP